MLFTILLLSLFQNVFSCTPAISTPLFTPVVQPPSFAPVPQLPLTSFQLDNSRGEDIPISEDYSDSVSVQKDSIIPTQNEKSKLHFSVFDLFRPLALSPTPPAISKQTTTDQISMNITFSPPVQWTYCEPICGVGDQAVDAENAYENAKDDVTEAVKAACDSSASNCESSKIDFQYHPESILIEDFGAYFDLHGNRYRISGKTVAFKINNQNPGYITSFTLPMRILFQTGTAIDLDRTQNLKQKIVDYLAARKNLHIVTNYV